MICIYFLLVFTSTNKILTIKVISQSILTHSNKVSQTTACKFWNSWFSRRASILGNYVISNIFQLTVARSQ